MKPHLILLRGLLSATAAVALAAIAAPPASAQGNSNCAGGNVSAGNTCVIQGYNAAFSSDASGTINLGTLTIDLTAGSVTMSPAGNGNGNGNAETGIGASTGGTTPVKVTTTYIPGGAPTPTIPAVANDASNSSSSPVFTVTQNTGSSSTTVSVTQGSVTVQPQGSGSAVTITPGCTITFTTSGADPTSC